MSPNPSGLLSSKGMRALVEWAEASFDFVIIDSPPISPIADAILLGHLSDGVVITVHAGRTPRDQVARVRDEMWRSNIRILGVLLNNLDDQGGKYGYGGYYYYYGKPYARSDVGDASVPGTGEKPTVPFMSSES
jgi:polysaccharide biosynthesis transport protein